MPKGSQGWNPEELMDFLFPLPNLISRLFLFPQEERFVLSSLCLDLHTSLGLL